MSVAFDPDANIWLPGGMVNSAEARIDRAVREYDERLRFGRNERDGQWCVFRYLFPAGEAPDDLPELFPILGFGFDRPTPQQVVERLEQSDSWRRNAARYDDVAKERERLHRQRESERQDQTAEAAERMEHAMRKDGMITTYKSLPIVRKG